MLTITNEDNMEMMARYPDKYFDLAIVDPPYGIGFSDYQRNSMGEKVKQRFTKNGKKKWDNNCPPDEYFIELMRISKNQIIWGGNYFTFLAKKESPNLKTIAEFKDYINNSDQNWLFWYKQNPVPNFADGELAWLSPELIPGQFDFKYYGNLQGNTFADDKIHPTQKPLQLYRYLLKTYAQDGYKIIDTHLGSMSIAIACVELLFNLDGCEIEKEYFESGKKRITEFLSQLDLFTPQPQIIWEKKNVTLLVK